MDAENVPYADRIDARADRVVQQARAVRKEILASHERLARLQEDLHAELAVMRTELRALDATLTHTVVNLRGVVHAFQHVVKRQELVRLQQRVDMWAPEQRLTRTALKRMIEDDASS